MAMTEAEKKRVPRSERGIPSKSGTGSYPMPNARHAAAAIGFATMHHGPAFAAKIRARAQRLGFAGGDRSERSESEGGRTRRESESRKGAETREKKRRQSSAFYGEE